MTDDGGWTHAASPFHRGEQAVQQRLGVRDKLEGFGRRVIRDSMPEQHRAFFGMLPFVVIGTVDAAGWPWASILAGPPGFVSSPDARSLRIAATPLGGDPLQAALHDGADVGILGIQLETRRRNRLSGRVGAISGDGFTVAVRQSFGNCPQYIQTRAVAFEPRPAAATARPAVRRDRLDARARALIARADTLFIASSYADGGSDPANGADVSHRGGKPGFVLVEDDKTLVFPDYSGNLHFNTIGNIQMNPCAGLLFIDFERGDVVQVTARAEIVWAGEAVRAFAGAERLLRFGVERMVRLEGGLPLRFAFGEYSPSLAATGSWSEAREAIAAARRRDTFIDHEVFRVEAESETIRSFYLRRSDGKALAAAEPGQFLPIRLTVPGTAAPVVRCYTVSDAPSRNHYRVSVKREDGGLVSRFLHDHAGPGFRLEAMAPRGTFVLDAAATRRVVLVSGGVGITPMVAMTNQLIDRGRRTGDFRRIHFIHGTTNGRTLAFGRHLRRLARDHPSLTLHIRFSQPSAEDRLGETHDSVGRVDLDLLRDAVPSADDDVYLCGPAGFMQSLYDALTGLGVPEARIHHESFGPATVLGRDRQRPAATTPGETAAGPVLVRFAAANVEAEWRPEKGTLLDLAEAAGLRPAFGCRSGICGSCATRITCGAVDYVGTPVGVRGDKEVLLCCAVPRSTAGPDSCGDRHGVVLDL